MSESASARAATCRALQRLDRAVEDAIGPELAASPYRGLLLSIYLAEMENRPIFQSSLATDAVAAKPHRRSIKLAQLGALTREPDWKDRRRTDLRLTPTTKDALDRALDSVRILMPNPVDQTGHPSGSPPELIGAERMWYKLDDGNDHEPADMIAIRGRVIAGGRIDMPAGIRHALGLKNGDTVFFELDGDDARIRPARSALRRLQDRLRAFKPEHGLMSEKLIAERRAEAGDE